MRQQTAEFDCTYERKRLDFPRYQGSLKTVNSEQWTVNSDACYGGGFKPATNAFGSIGVVFPPEDETDNW